MKDHVFTKRVAAMGMQGEAEVFVQSAPGEIVLTVEFKGRLMNFSQSFRLEPFEAVELLDSLARGISNAGLKVMSRHYHFENRAEKTEGAL